MILSAEPGNGLTLDEMHSNAEFFILAGSETTGKYNRNHSLVSGSHLAPVLTCMIGTLLSGAIYLLLNNPTQLEELEREVRTQAKAGALTFERLAGLKYLNACMYIPSCSHIYL